MPAAYGTVATKVINLTVTHFDQSSMNEAHQQVADIATKHGAKLTGWEATPGLLESYPPQSRVAATVTGPPGGVAATIHGVELLDETV
jgi:hypothetical protein